MVDLDTDTLLQAILVLVVVWLVLEVLGELVDTLGFILAALPKLLGLVVVALLVLALFDRL